MKAISIKQPWATLIAQGHKRIETRTWQTAYRGDILICASAKPADFLRMRPRTIHPEKGVWCDDTSDGECSGFFQFGKALCIAELYHIEPMTDDHELDALCEVYPGAYAWHLRNIRIIKPFEVKGQLNIFEIDFKQ